MSIRRREAMPVSSLNTLRRVGSAVGRGITGLFDLIRALFMLAVILALGTLMLQNWRSWQLPDTFFIHMDLRQPLIESGRAAGVFDFMVPARTLAIEDVVAALHDAAADPRVAGLAVMVGDRAPSLALMQELEGALAELRAAGKRVVAWADSFGEMSPGTQAYAAAVPFGEVWLQPTGMVAATGLITEELFFGGLLARHGISVDIGLRGDFKTAMNPLLEQGFTSAHRSATESVLQDLDDQIGELVERHRAIPREEFRTMVQRAPLLDREALEAGLVDRLGYLDEFHALAGEGRMVALAHYTQTRRRARVREARDSEAPLIGYVRISGPIGRGPQQGFDLASRSSRVPAERIAAAIVRAVEADRVDALVVRVASPGGSPVASETIRRALEVAREAGIPVVVSMGTVAASGGYWLAMDADRIYALPATITGSIGVLGGRLAIDEALERLGVHAEAVKTAPDAGMWSLYQPLGPSAVAKRDRILDDLYARFVDGVARGRGLDRAQAEEAAQGRIWTGRQALDLGLVDALGGHREAMTAAARLAGATNGAHRVVEIGGGGGWMLAVGSTVATLVEQLGSTLDATGREPWRMPSLRIEG
ncbi:MAG: signal peptide peptidase SppA [Geminicoccaceae bacterium]|nr:MAG: signal peptide peptidase SppA [Geminicoccaceae bacterium]